MAQQKGIIKLRGKIGEISFYKTQDGHLAREKGGVDGDRIKNDPAFVRTRENGAEFGSSANSGKLLRDTLRPMLLNTADNRITSRLTKIMTDIKNYDTTSARGERSVAVGIADPAAIMLIKGFNFNNRAVLGSVLYKPFKVDTITGIIKINGLVPINDIAFPAGATHVSLKCAWAKIDFSTGVKDLQISNVQNFPIDAVPNNILLTPAAVPAGVGNDFYLLHLEFFQDVNGTQYSLKNGAYNALAIVEAQ